jgi:hypothetical protein
LQLRSRILTVSLIVGIPATALVTWMICK